jgi:thioredoxin reductase
MKACDVAVVGAGPADCSSAITLAQRGLQVALIDRALFQAINCPAMPLRRCETDSGSESIAAPAFGHDFRRRSSFCG